MRLFSAIWLLCFSLNLYSDGYQDHINRLKKAIRNPELYLKEVGPLVLMGNASIASAKIIFLPEIHDDPESLTTQMLFIAQEKKKSQPFIVLDESLSALKKSSWDFFSQKTLEILAAYDQRRAGQAYAPQKFELALKNLANKFRSTPGNLNYVEKNGLWTMADFTYDATPFFGWDLVKNASLTERNVQLVNSLEAALKEHDRVMVMAGARHVPELEFLTSQRLLCNGDKFADMKQYFATLQSKFGSFPKLRNGIGATTPIYNFLVDQPYAVVFSQGLYKELDHIVEQFKAPLGAGTCLTL